MPKKFNSDDPDAVSPIDGGVVIDFASASGVTESFRQQIALLFELHHAALIQFLIFRLGSRAEAEDVVQETFIRIFRRQAMQPTDRFPGLLFVTARNIATDRLRQRQLYSAYAKDQFGADVELATPEQITLDREQLNVLQNALKELPPKCYQAFLHYKLETMDYDEIAELMGLSESMVRKYVSRAVAHCAACLGREGIKL